MFCMFCVPVNSVLSDARPVGRIRRSRRIRQCLPAATQNFFLISPHALQPFATCWRIVTLAIHFPDRLPRQRFLLFQQCQTRSVIARRFQLAQLSGRFQQRTQQGFFHIACTNDPRGNAVDRGIEEVKADMHPVKQIVTHNLTGNCLVSSSSSTT